MVKACNPCCDSPTLAACIGPTVTLTDQTVASQSLWRATPTVSGTGPYTYAWTINGQNAGDGPTLEGTATGPAVINLSVSNACGADTAASTISIATSPTANCVLLDATLTGLPDTTGFTAATVFYQAHFYPNGVTVCTGTPPTNAAASQVAAQINALPAGSTVMLDLEHTWPWQTCGNVQASLAALHDMLDLLIPQLTDPTLKFGFYGLPVRNYWDAIAGPADAGYQSWQAINDTTQTLIDRTTAVFPSIYSLYPDTANTPWTPYAAAMINEAERLAGSLPVYPILWHTYHPSNGAVGGTQVDADFWGRQLDFVHQNADGIVVWNEPADPVATAPWWNETQDWIADNGC